MDYFLVLNRELGIYRLSEMEWSILQDFDVILKVQALLNNARMHLDEKYQVPHKVQQVMSGETTPILASVIPTFKLFMTQWEDLSKKHSTLTPWINIGLRYVMKYYGRMDQTRSYIITMGESFRIMIVISIWRRYVQVLNPTIHMSWIRAHWGLQYISKAEQAIKDTVSH